MPSARRLLPTVFRHQRVFVAPRTLTGATVEFHTDSGGGMNARLQHRMPPRRQGLIDSAEILQPERADPSPGHAAQAVMKYNRDHGRGDSRLRDASV